MNGHVLASVAPTSVLSAQFEELVVRIWHLVPAQRRHRRPMCRRRAHASWQTFRMSLEVDCRPRYAACLCQNCTVEDADRSWQHVRL